MATENTFNYERLVAGIGLFAMIRPSAKGNNFNIYDGSSAYKALAAKLGIENAGPVGESMDVPLHVVQRVVEIITSPDNLAQPWTAELRALRMAVASTRFPAKNASIIIPCALKDADRQIAAALQVLADHGLAKDVSVTDDNKGLNVTAEAELCIRWLRGNHLDNSGGQQG